jgi:hypothetical protein
VGPRAGLNVVEKRKFLTLPGLELRPLGRPDRSQSLYLLCYPDSYQDVGGWIILKWILERYDGVVWTGLIWFRIETSGGLL